MQGTQLFSSNKILRQKFAPVKSRRWSFHKHNNIKGISCLMTKTQNASFLFFLHCRLFFFCLFVSLFFGGIFFGVCFYFQVSILLSSVMISETQCIKKKNPSSITAGLTAMHGHFDLVSQVTRACNSHAWHQRRSMCNTDELTTLIALCSQSYPLLLNNLQLEIQNKIKGVFYNKIFEFKSLFSHLPPVAHTHTNVLHNFFFFFKEVSFFNNASSFKVCV